MSYDTSRGKQNCRIGIIMVGGIKIGGIDLSCRTNLLLKRIKVYNRLMSQIFVANPKLKFAEYFVMQLVTHADLDN